MSKIIVKIPATSANLGPGFDTLGIALSFYNKFIFEKKEQFEFINVLEKYANENNLIVRSAIETYNYIGSDIIPFSLEEDQEIPISRGLGSSATCIVAGIMAANYFAGNKLSKNEILKIATGIEGHPDNVAPAIFGGLVSSFKNFNEIEYTKYEVSNSLFFTVAIPNFALTTHKARGALPKKLSYSDVIYSLSRAINIPKAMELGDVRKLYSLLSDKIHQPYRMKLINESYLFKDFSKRTKTPFCISGSGSTLLFVSDYEIIMKLNRIRTKNQWVYKSLKPDLIGATLEVLDEK